jgi:hypothetical protein
MSTDYRPMWKELGLDLEAHDALLGVLGPLYEPGDEVRLVVKAIHVLPVKE